jgi:hypothetical protein
MDDTEAKHLSTDSYSRRRVELRREILVMESKIEILYGFTDPYEDYLSLILQKDFEDASIEINAKNSCYILSFVFDTIKVELIVVFDISGKALFVHDISSSIIIPSLDNTLMVQCQDLDWLPVSIKNEGEELIIGIDFPLFSINISTGTAKYNYSTEKPPYYSYVMEKIEKLKIPIGNILDVFREIQETKNVISEMREKLGDMEVENLRQDGLPVPNILEISITEFLRRPSKVIYNEIQKLLRDEIGFTKDYIKAILREKFHITSAVLDTKSLFYAATFEVEHYEIRVKAVFNKSGELMFVHNISNEPEPAFPIYVHERNGRKLSILDVLKSDKRCEIDDDDHDLSHIFEKPEKFNIPFNSLIKLEELMQSISEIPLEPIK